MSHDRRNFPDFSVPSDIKPAAAVLPSSELDTSVSYRKVFYRCSHGEDNCAECLRSREQVLKTLTRCQEECTKLLEENRKITASLAAEQKSHDDTIDELERLSVRVDAAIERCDSLQVDFAALVKEYDEEVISHDIEEAGLKEQRNAARKELELCRKERQTYARDLEELAAWKVVHQRDIELAHSQFANLEQAVRKLAALHIQHAPLCRNQQMGDMCDCDYWDRKRQWEAITGLDL